MSLDTTFFGKHLDDDEQITLVVHKHWLVGIGHLFWPTAVFIGLWGLLYLAPIRPMLYGVSILSVGIVVWWMRNFLDYYLDAWIITTHGVIDVEWHGWFHRQSTRVIFSDIQGVSYEIQGIVGTLLNFGTIGVEKISSGNVVTIGNIPNPRSVETAILQNMEAYLHTKNLADAKQVQEILSAIVAREIKLQDFDDGEENV